MKDFDYLFANLRRIEEHREAAAEKQIRGIYQDVLKGVRQYLAEEYYQLAEDGKLTFDILRSKNMDARFLEELERQIDDLSSDIANEIRETVRKTYQQSFDGMVDAVKKAKNTKELRSLLGDTSLTAADRVKAVVENPFMEIALEKNHKENIWNIKREVSTGLTNGDRYDTISRRISAATDNSYRKSVLIARTETHRVRETAHVDAAGEINQALEGNGSGLRMVKKWMTMQDGAVRPNVRYKTKKGWKSGKPRPGAPNHVKMHGVVVEEGEPFDLGGGVTAMAPGQSGVAGHDCNCRCTVLHLLMTDEEFFKATGRHFSGKNLKNDNNSHKMEMRTGAEEFTPAKTIKEAEQYAKSTLGIECSYKGVDLQCANEMNAAFKRGIDYCPAIKDRLSFVGSGQERNRRFKAEMTDFYLNELKAKYPNQSDTWYSTYAKSFANRTVGRIDGRTYAFASGRGASANDIVRKYSGIVVNNKWGGDSETFIRSLKQSVTIKWHPVGCDTIASVFDHEVAHQIDYAVGIRDSEELKELWNSLSKDEIKEGLSAYGSSSIAEFIAEGYAEFVNNASPRTIARKIGEIIKKAVKDHDES